MFVLLATFYASSIVGVGQVETKRLQDELVVETASRDGKKVIVVKHLSDLANASMQVWVDTAKRADPPVMGATSVLGKKLVFVPRFPIRSGASYRIEVVDGRSSEPVSLRLEIAAEGKLPTEVKAVYPSANLIPENVLKFYVHFSQPMRKGEIYQYMKIREFQGKEIKFPFLEIEQEFWSKDSKRLTLLLDPGRIKRGLKPREEMGPILVDGKTYELVLSGKWPDADGNELGQDFVKKFKAGSVDHAQPDPEKWAVITPKPDSRDALVIKLEKPLDHSMLFRSINVLGASSNRIEGEVAVSKGETVWTFIPATAWSAGEYQISIDSDLEDNCGNSVGRQFDVDVFDKTEPSTVKTRLLKFRIEE